MIELNGVRRVLICGHRSYAAQGLAELLRQAGHEVVCFSRGTIERRNGVVTGPVNQLHQNPHLSGSFDTVVNYIVLGKESVDCNLQYLTGLLSFCEERKVNHLIHVSSLSVYKSTARLINEYEGVETDPTKKGAYGALKIAAEQYLTKNLPATTKLSLLRPGFILDPGLNNPIGGTGLRLPWGRLLTIGNPKGSMPLITRDLVNQAVLGVLVQPPAETSEALLLVDSHSPTREEFLEACCKELGCGAGVKSYPAAVWLGAGLFAEISARLIGRSRIQPLVKARSICRNHQFDTGHTQRRLGMEFSIDWTSALRKSMEGQDPNFRIPLHSSERHPKLTNVTFLGFGRIVKQKYLPALKRLGFPGKIKAYDLKAYADKELSIQSIDSAQLDPADLFVVATPGPVHIEALTKLETVEGAVLIEKPLCYSVEQLERWMAFARLRKSPVLVCHNYRFKRNVETMMEFLSKFNPGKLLNVNVHFESPSVNSEPLLQRDERCSQTLLMDYSLHFLDLACMFGEGDWQTSGVRYELNARGQTSLIEGRLISENYAVSFLLRQGFGLRRARLFYNFQNYSVSLGFFPDTFVPCMANDNPAIHLKEAMASAAATFRKVLDRLTSRDSDPSHKTVLAMAASGEEMAGETLTIGRLASFYRAMFKIADIVYND